MGKISTLGVLRLRAIKLSVTERSVRRSAQDDVSVVSWRCKKSGFWDRKLSIAEYLEMWIKPGNKGEMLCGALPS